MAEVTLAGAVEKLEAETQRLRNEGVEDLKLLLGQGKNNNKFDNLTDDGFHGIFEALYRLVRAEKSQYLRASKSITKSSIASRLSTAALSLRLAVEVGCAKIKFKTAISVLDHIISTLPGSGSLFCEPLQNDYLRCFRIILDHAPHAEHLRPKQWQTYVDFILNAVATMSTDYEAEDELRTAREPSLSFRSGMNLSVRSSQRSIPRSPKFESKSHVDDLIAALSLLSGLPNVSLISRANEIGGTMIEFLNSFTRSQEAAFDCLNNVLMTTITEDLRLTQKLLVSLVPMIRRLWSTKSNSLRDRMLITLLCCQYLFLVPSDKPMALETEMLEQLFDTLSLEYSNRQQRDILQSEDLILTPNFFNSGGSVYDFSPLPDSSRAVSCHRVLSVMATLIFSLSNKSSSESRELITDDVPRKRRKIRTPIEELVDNALSTNNQSRQGCVQALVFLFDQPLPVPDAILKQIPRFVDTPIDDDAHLASWIMILLARFIQYQTPCESLDASFGEQLWNLARRNVSSTTAVRAACFLLDALLQSKSFGSTISSTTIVDTLFGAGINGPCVLTDSAMFLFKSILTGDYFDYEEGFEAFVKKVLSWISYQWIIPSVVDRNHNAQLAFHAQPEHLISVFAATRGVLIELSPSTEWMSSNVVYRASHIIKTKQKFIQYLLGIKPNLGSAPEFRGKGKVISASCLGRINKILSGTITARIKDFCNSWTVLYAERPSNINANIIEILTSACAVTCALSAKVSDELAPLELSSSLIDDLWKIVYSFLDGQPSDEFALLTTRVGAILLRLQSNHNEIQGEILKSRQKMTESMIDFICEKLDSQISSATSDIDLMDSMDLPSSNITEMSTSKASYDVSRLDIPIALNATALLAHQYVLFLTEKGYVQHGLQDSNTATHILEEVIKMPSTKLLMSKAAIVRFLDLDPSITRALACRLLERLAKTCLQDDDYERCETALCFCLNVMKSIVHLWAFDEEDDELTAVAFDMYSWYINTALRRGIASQRVLLDLVELVNALLQVNGSYGGGELPSPRTSLLEILQISNANSRFSLASKLSRLFDRYVLTQHEAIFVDVVESLPADPDHYEGLAARVYVLAEVGAQWRTVLRQAVYHMFETAARVMASIPIVQECVLIICRQLSLSSGKDLFKLFCSQILYTWFGTGNLSSIPYQAFEYATLKDLILANVDEFVAQIALRGSTKLAQEICQILGRNWEDLLKHSFAKVESYTISSEISIPPADRLFQGSENLVRKQIGTEEYLQSLRYHIPDIIGELIAALQDDRGIERSFEKARHEEALVTLRSITERSSSSVDLPLGQQPSFRARFLLEELEYLYSRTELTSEDVWSPALVVHVYRILLDDISPALGQLHTCSVLRKLRIVLCLAGNVTSSGYPLEMLLHNFQPYLTMFHTSDDALGMFWYLLEKGKDHLSQRPSFLAGLAVSVCAMLTRFARSTPESTTQESQFQTTMSKAQEFRAWFGEYLRTFTVIATAEKEQTFRFITLQASSLQKPVSNSKSTAGGALLFGLLNDQTSSDPLFSRNHFDLVMQVLCSDFEKVDVPQDDILSDEDDLMRIVPVLYSVLNRLDLTAPFRTWAGVLIGRGYKSRSTIPITKVTSLQEENYASHENQLNNLSSYTNILKFLIELVWKDNYRAAMFAEKTLQLISSAVGQTEQPPPFGHEIDRLLLQDLKFSVFPCPEIRNFLTERTNHPSLDQLDGNRISETWAADLVGAICFRTDTDPVLNFLAPLVYAVPKLAETLVPFVIHLVLLGEQDDRKVFRPMLSRYFSQLLTNNSSSSNKPQQVVLNTILYLRRCQVPNEPNMAMRNSWLDLDFQITVDAAISCRAWSTALLFLEIYQSELILQTARTSRRSSTSDAATSLSATTTIFQHVDDQDFFYGDHTEVDMQSILQKLNHEDIGFKALAFQSAFLDSALRSDHNADDLNDMTSITAKILSNVNLHGISRAVDFYASGIEHKLSSTKLQVTNNNEWDFSVESTNHAASYSPSNTFRVMANLSDKISCLKLLDQAILKTVSVLFDDNVGSKSRLKLYGALEVLSDATSMISMTTHDNLVEIIPDAIQSTKNRHGENFDSVSAMLLGRESLLSTIKQSEKLRAILRLSLPEALLLEIKAVRQSLNVAQTYNKSQFCLNRATYLTKLSEVAADHGIHVEAAAQYDLARTLWAQEEVSASINILKALTRKRDLPDQSIAITNSIILTDLGHKIAQARFEKPDEIMANYLLPALKHLRNKATGGEAGQVYHSFATFCDMQIQDSDSIDDLARLEKIRDRKRREVRELDIMVKKNEGKMRDQLKMHLSKAKTWFKLDDEEFQRVQANRLNLILQCLENYLLSMRACDDFPRDAIRFLALWLNQSSNKKANASVKKYLASVSSMKFAPLMNQLTSRILDEETDFQDLLQDLMFRICSDHPFHSLYQVFATSKSRGVKTDPVAASRNKAATKLAELIRQKGSSTNIWVAIHNTNISFVKVTQEKLMDKDIKTGSKILLRKMISGQKLISTVEDASTKIPPPTMNIPLRADCDYSSIPTFTKFEPQISIAGGVSAPKIATIIATDGSRHKILLKGGNDDLRQDSIMEQVFELVSNLLKDHRETRQRNLGIRTYKVIPLFPNVGIIEFVKDTIPLHDYLLPAHTRYYPKDYKPSRCRKEIADVQTKPLDQRIQAYRNVTTNFHPVMRFFFMEHFLDPDEWFYKRLNYSRSTAAISILGHVLGLGDRHGHNVLLDKISGEVVHIDLGVAFEAGRVLPVPEVVPFRLTRDLVDGMGISGVEGVFRRCCNFTLEALRHDQEAIMTILDVLRYDPLYSWSISPLRLQKMQENNNQAGATEGATINPTMQDTDGNVNVNISEGAEIKAQADETSEADRALTVVAKKLGKSLSVEATVNELIRQATDERNLGVLYCGWAAYA